MAKYIILEYGFDPQYVVENYPNQDVLRMSGKASDRFWKKSCNNRPYQLDGLPFNIFLVHQKGQKQKKSSTTLDSVRQKYPFPNVNSVDSFRFELFGVGRDMIVDTIHQENVNLMLEMGCFLCGICCSVVG